jgi:hypothetical protein
MTVFVGFATLILYQLAVQRGTQTLLLASSGEPPDLTLDESMVYMLFLSHVWASGQDQAAVIKRQLQLLMPGLVVFLDVPSRAIAPTARCTPHHNRPQCTPRWCDGAANLLVLLV